MSPLCAESADKAQSVSHSVRQLINSVDSARQFTVFACVFFVVDLFHFFAIAEKLGGYDKVMIISFCSLFLTFGCINCNIAFYK